ncbi:MAG: hypothetical protein ACO1OB_01860 [Archangium sp.]
MKAGLFVGIGCGAILGAAVWFAASDPDPVVPSVANPTPTPIAAPSRPVVRDAIPDPIPERPTVAAPVQQVVTPDAPRAVVAAPPPPMNSPAPVVADEMPPELRFKGQSRELDYADNLIGKANPTLEEVRSANDVFARCVEVDPENQRCNESLERSRIALSQLSRSRRVESVLESPRMRSPSEVNLRLPNRR